MERILFYTLILMVLLITAIRLATYYKQERTKGTLNTLIINIIGIIVIILAYFFPLNSWFHGTYTIRIIILICFLLFLFVTLFYWDIKQYIRRQKNKNKKM
jgi:hypothetical protein